MWDNARPFEVVDNPVVHKAAGNLAAHIGTDIVVVAVHKVGPDIAVGVARKVEMDTATAGAARKTEMDIVAETAHIETDIESDHTVEIDRVLTVVDIVAED